MAGFKQVIDGKGSGFMTLLQEATQAINTLSNDDLRSLVDYAYFLISSADSRHVRSGNSDMGKKSLIGRLKGRVKLAEDFNDLPDGFEACV